MTEKEQILCLDVIQGLRDRFISRGWITVSDKVIHSALVSDDKVDECMQDYQWDLPRGDGGAYINSYGGSYEYVRGKSGLELFVIYREGYGIHHAYVELSEEFRLFCNMHERYLAKDEREYIIVDDNGNENVVAIIKGLHVTIKAKVIRSYLAARSINLLVFVDIMRYSKLTYTELGIVPEQNKIISEDNLIYNYTNLIPSNLFDGNKSGGWVMGKCLLRYNTSDFDPDQYPYFSDDSFEDYIIGYDKNGDKYSYTCDESKLSNYFKQRGDAPLTVTPVFFRKTVLDKYYNDPNRYQVDDGCILCERVWSLRWIMINETLR